MNDTGKDTRTEEYYRGCTLVLRARALKKFTGLYVAGVSAEGLWEGFEVSDSLLIHYSKDGGGVGREEGHIALFVTSYTGQFLVRSCCLLIIRAT